MQWSRWLPALSQHVTLPSGSEARLADGSDAGGAVVSSPPALPVLCCGAGSITGAGAVGVLFFRSHALTRESSAAAYTMLPVKRVLLFMMVIMRNQPGIGLMIGLAPGS